MKQVRVFVANSSDVNIDIKDANVQSILKTGNRVAFFYEDQIFYATHANQTKWYSFTPEGGGTGPAVPADQNVLNANLITSNKGDQVEPFTISKAVKSNAAGDQWIEFVIADNAFKHEKLTGGSHVDINMAYAHVHNADAGETVSDMYSDANADKEDFQNVLAMIFRQPLTSVNHNIDGISRTLTSNDLVRRYEENNLVNYAIHTDRMVLVEGDSTIAFENIPAGQYKFPIAKIVHATASNIAAVQQIVASAFKSNDTYYIAKAFVTPAGMNIINEVREGCDDRDANISVETENGISTIYMNITFSGTYTENVWTCNANVKGSEHTRFPKLLANKFHGVVGTSYDCFNNPVILNEYTAANADKYQERYESKLMYSKGYPYAIRINIKPNTSYTAYTPNFVSSEEKSYSLSIDGIEYFRYTSVSADTKSLIYDAAYEKPSGLLLFSYRDIFDKREYTATHKVEDLLDPSVVYTVKNVDGKMYNVLDIDVTVSRGKANLNSVDGISFIAYAVLPAYKDSRFPDYNNVGFDLDSNLTYPKNDSGGTGTNTYNNNASSLLGISLLGSTDTSWAGFKTDAINTYCSGDNIGNYNADTYISSFPYITLPSEFKQQSFYINSNIMSQISRASQSSTYEEINDEVKEITGDRVSITVAEYNSLDKSNINASLAAIVSKKLLDNWNGEIVTSELYYFNMGHPYFDVQSIRELQDTWMFVGYRADIPGLIINKKREIYNLMFTLYRNKKRDDEMDITVADIETQSITFPLGGSNSPSSTVNCPTHLKRRFNGKEYRYKLVYQQHVSARVLKEHTYAFCGYDNTTLANHKQGLFSFLYKIEPDTDNGKTAADYPADDYLLGTDDYPLSKYDPKAQSKGCWLMCHPLLHTNASGSAPMNFGSVANDDYYPDTHIIRRGNTYYYATPYDIKSETASSYENLSAAFIEKATEIGLPLFSIVFFDVKAINPLSVNLRQFLQNVVKNHIESYISQNPGKTITDVPGITVSSADKTVTLSCSTAGSDVLSTLKRILTKASTSTTITYAYDDPNNQDFWPTDIKSSGNHVKYGVYNYNSSPEVDDWEFEFITD